MPICCCNAAKVQQSDTVCWRNTMVTDSSIFTMHAMGKPAGSWCTQATRGTAGRPNHSLGVHYYKGMTYWGVTTIKFVDRHTQTSTEVTNQL